MAPTQARLARLTRFDALYLLTVIIRKLYLLIVGPANYSTPIFRFATQSSTWKLAPPRCSMPVLNEFHFSKRLNEEKTSPLTQVRLRGTVQVRHWDGVQCSMLQIRALEIAFCSGAGRVNKQVSRTVKYNSLQLCASSGQWHSRPSRTAYCVGRPVF